MTWKVALNRSTPLLINIPPWTSNLCLVKHTNLNTYFFVLIIGSTRTNHWINIQHVHSAGNIVELSKTTLYKHDVRSAIFDMNYDWTRRDRAALVRWSVAGQAFSLSSPSSNYRVKTNKLESKAVGWIDLLGPFGHFGTVRVTFESKVSTTFN